MEGPYIQQPELRVWERRSIAGELQLLDCSNFEIELPSLDPAELARREALRPIRRRRGQSQPEPYSLPWFLEIERHRYTRPGSSLPYLLEFRKHAGETVLGLGSLLGTDLVQYALNDCRLIVANASAELLTLSKRNLQLRGLSARCVQAGLDLPLPSSSIDVVYLDALATPLAQPRAWADEIFRVLKPGGKIVSLWPARYNVAYWESIFFPWQRLFHRVPAVNPHSQTSYSLRQIFEQFTEHRTHKRHLRRSELPHLWRWQPLVLLERLMGQLLVFKAFKPLSTARTHAVNGQVNGQPGGHANGHPSSVHTPA
jgi:SAM-dependent methyltransferase